MNSKNCYYSPCCLSTEYSQVVDARYPNCCYDEPVPVVRPIQRTFPLLPEPNEEVLKYMLNDIFGVKSLVKSMQFKPKKVIFNDPATIVIWADGTKTVVKCQKPDKYNKTTGLALCFMKRALDDSSRTFNDILHEYIVDEPIGDLEIPLGTILKETIENVNSILSNLQVKRIKNENTD